MQLFDTYWWLFGTICTVVGLFVALFGRSLLRIVLFIVGMGATVFAIIILFYSTFLQDNTEDWIFWTVLGASVLLGALIGFLCTKLVKFGGAILSAWGGFMVGMLINESWLYMYGLTWLFWTSCIALALIFFVIGWIFFEPAVIVSTAFIGSYFVARGVGCFINNASFPSVFVLISEVQSGGVEKISNYYYIYFAGILLLTAFGSFIQYKIYKKHNAKK